MFSLARTLLACSYITSDPTEPGLSPQLEALLIAMCAIEVQERIPYDHVHTRCVSSLDTRVRVSGSPPCLSSARSEVFDARIPP